MPASDHGSMEESIAEVKTLHPSSLKVKNGHVEEQPLLLNRAEELEDLLDAVKSLIVPYVREADEEAEVKHKGRLSFAKDDSQPHNVLVESHTPRELLQRFDLALPTGEGRGKDGLLNTIKDILKYSVNTWDQGFMDKLTASTNPVGVISEMILGVLNTNVHVFHVSPALSIVEKVTARVLASYFGFTGPHAGGITCQGGSASNLTSLVIARNVLYADCYNRGSQGYNFAIFTSEHGHFSVEKAAVVCGIGASNVIRVPADKSGCMSAMALRQLVAQAKANGQTPLYVNATAGTTVYGKFDPIVDIRKICDDFGMWLHVDGSWGGALAFSSKHKHKLQGCELADSLTMNPHKILNVPMTCSFLLTNDLRNFHRANSLRAGYLFHGPEDDEVWDLADLTLQCGRRADALKMALAWIYYGAAGFERSIEHAFDMAERLATLVDESPDFELISERPTSCLQVCFYYSPTGGSTASAEENTRRTRAMAYKMIHRGFMFDYAPGPRGDLFRIVVNCQTLPTTVDGLMKGLVEAGQEVMTEGLNCECAS